MKSSLVDILYFLAITMTTVGLGDLHPVTPFGKAYAIFWLILMSLGFANVISQYANLKVKERERDTVHAVLVGTAGEKMFEEIDGDQDGTLSEAEYLGYIVCKLRKVSPAEVCIYFFKKIAVNVMPSSSRSSNIRLFAPHLLTFLGHAHLSLLVTSIGSRDHSKVSRTGPRWLGFHYQRRDLGIAEKRGLKLRATHIRFKMRLSGPETCTQLSC